MCKATYYLNKVVVWPVQILIKFNDETLEERGEFSLCLPCVSDLRTHILRKIKPCSWVE